MSKSYSLDQIINLVKIQPIEKNQLYHTIAEILNTSSSDNETIMNILALYERFINDKLLEIDESANFTTQNGKKGIFRRID